MSTRKVRFAKPDGNAFNTEVRTRVANYFTEKGISDKANGAMVLKTVILLSLPFVCYGLIMSNQFTPWQMLGLAVLMGAGMAGIGFSVAHDALHGAYSNNATVNRILGYGFDIVGANGYMWKITHNVIHHTYTNIHGVDEDLTVSPLLRLSPGSDVLWFHKYQHLYGFLAYSFATINWVFAKDYQQFLKKDIGPYQNKKHPPKEIAILFASKIFCYFYTIVLPLIVLDITWWQFLIGFLAMHVTAGSILGIIFQLAHVVEGPEYPMPDSEGRIEESWILHEMQTTANFAKKNLPLSWYIGGLNYQIEHHLFPQVCSIHYPAISGIVQKTAEEFGVPYHYNPTLWAAVKSHYRMLKKFSRPDPVPVNAMAMQ